MFDKFDQDGGGELDHGEVVNMLRQLGKNEVEIENIRKTLKD